VLKAQVADENSALKGWDPSSHPSSQVMPLSLLRSTALSMEEDAAESFSELYQVHFLQVWRWVHRLAGPGADAEDLVQDVFAIAHRKLATFRRASSTSTWLYGIAAKVVRDDRRKRRFRAFWVRPRIESDDAVSGSASPEAMLESAEELRRIYGALNRLRERYRAVLVLHELEGATHQEIAALMGVKPSNVSVWLHRAREAFSRQLAEIDAKEDAP
jgi:RNA polymerase sigma-70 factor, ECF subfamily